jgi:hypothetical protein
MSQKSKFVELKFKQEPGKKQNLAGYVVVGDLTEASGERTLILKNAAQAEAPKAAKVKASRAPKADTTAAD